MTTHEKTRPAYRYQAKLVSAHDGDTQTFLVDLGFGVLTKIKIRLLGWNCAELNEPGGKEARDAAQGFLTAAGVIILETEKDDQTFARWLAHVYVDGRDLGELLAELNLAAPRA